MDTVLERPYAEHGRLLKKARAKRGITQLYLAFKTGIPVRMIQEYEQGKCIPSADRLIKIMVELRVDVETLMAIIENNEKRMLA